MMLHGTKITKVECLNNKKKKDNVNITYKGFGEGPCKKKKKKVRRQEKCDVFVVAGCSNSFTCSPNTV